MKDSYLRNYAPYIDHLTVSLRNLITLLTQSYFYCTTVSLALSRKILRSAHSGCSGIAKDASHATHVCGTRCNSDTTRGSLSDSKRASRVFIASQSFKLSLGMPNCV
jgi:hypothetical protein